VPVRHDEIERVVQQEGALQLYLRLGQRLVIIDERKIQLPAGKSREQPLLMVVGNGHVDVGVAMVEAWMAVGTSVAMAVGKLASRRRPRRSLAISPSSCSASSKRASTASACATRARPGVDDPELLESARRRAEAEGLEVVFLKGAAEDLPFPDGSFDVVLSACEAMSAPAQETMVGELLRVCRPGGRIGLVSWTPDGYLGHLFSALGRHLLAPAAGKVPILCGTKEQLRKLFGPEVAIAAPRRSFLWRFPSAEHQVAFLASFHDPTAEALQALEPDRADALKAELVEVARRFDMSEDDTLVLRLDYLEAVVRKPVWL
jgi:SAM-dependent methyltransferase